MNSMPDNKFLREAFNMNATGQFNVQNPTNSQQNQLIAA